MKTSQRTAKEAEPERLLRVPEAAELLGLTEKALRMRVTRGSIPFVRRGKRLRFVEIAIRQCGAATEAYAWAKAMLTARRAK